MPTFFVDRKNISGDTAVLSGTEAGHMLRSLRLSVGDSFFSFDEEGRRYRMRILEATSRSLRAEILEYRRRGGVRNQDNELIETAVFVRARAELVERRTGRDLCVSKDITGNRVVGQYTIPVNAGYVGAMGDPAQHGWTLDTDRTGHGNVDYWLKNGTVFKYPVAR